MLPALVLILLFIILLFPQFWVQKVIKKYSEPIKTLPGTGGELAQHLVKRFKLDGVSIKKVENGNDHYNPETKTDFEMLRSRIKEIANQELPEKCQEIFFLSRIENKKNSEIAQILGLSKRTVENQLYRALKIIKKILKEKI